MRRLKPTPQFVFQLYTQVGLTVLGMFLIPFFAYVIRHFGLPLLGNLAVEFLPPFIAAICHDPLYVLTLVLVMIFFWALDGKENGLGAVNHRRGRQIHEHHSNPHRQFRQRLNDRKRRS